MVPLVADRDAWGLYHSSRPISHTQLGLVVATFIVCYLGLLLILVAYTCLCSLWRHIANRERYKKPRTDRDGRNRAPCPCPPKPSEALTTEREPAGSGARGSGTVRTFAMEQQVVPADREAGRGQLVQTLRTAGHVEDPPAGTAVEMMMMPRCRVGTLVPRRLARDGHRYRGAIVKQGVQGPVDGRYAETGYRQGGQGQHLGRAQRPASLLDHATDCVSLLGIPVHSKLPDCLEEFPST